MKRTYKWVYGFLGQEPLGVLELSTDDLAEYLSLRIGAKIFSKDLLTPDENGECRFEWEQDTWYGATQISESFYVKRIPVYHSF